MMPNQLSNLFTLRMRYIMITGLESTSMDENVLCSFKCSSSLKVMWHVWLKKNSKSDSNNNVPLIIIITGTDISILLELE